MSELREELVERGVESLGDGGGPADRWQEQVLARIAVPPARRSRWPLVVVASGVAVAAASIALAFTLRDPAGPVIPARPAPATTQSAQDGRKLEAILKQHGDAIDDLAGQFEKKKKTRRWPKRDQDKVTVTCDPNDPLCAIE